jgi:hypothetical protein
MDEDTIAMLNASNNALIGEFIHQHPMGPIVWGQTWYEQDAYYCENNIITTNIVGCANNSSPITSTTSGEAAEEYLSKYMVKGKASLKQAVPSLLAASDQIIAHPSKTEDAGSIIWTGIHLAQRTVNTFSGSHQWSMPLMASALLGNKSIVSSELFRYVFPHANISYVNSLINSDSYLCHDKCAKSSHLMDENNEYAQSCLDAVMEAIWKDDDHDEVCGGANSYKTTDGKVVFLTQAESYHHRGPAFAHYSQLEFKCIVQLQEKVHQEKAELTNKSSKDRSPGNKASFVYILCWGYSNENVYVNVCRGTPSKISWKLTYQRWIILSWMKQKHDLLFQVLDRFVCNLVREIFSFVWEIYEWILFPY